MGKVKTEQVFKREHNINFKYDINVNASGEFYTMLPDVAVNMFENASIVLRENPYRRNGKRGFIGGASLKDVINSVDALMADYLSTTVVSESIILRYSIQTQCTYVLTNEGDIGPNGNYRSEKEGDYWKGGTVHPFANDREPYGFQVFIKPLVKRVLRYKSGKLKTEYCLVSQAGVSGFTKKPLHLGENGKWLDDIVGMGPIGVPKEMEYTEEMAEFFVNMVKSICRLNERIKDYIEPETLLLMMNKGQGLLD